LKISEETIILQIQLKMDFAANNIMTGQEFFDRILLADGLAHIAENIFDQLDPRPPERYELDPPL
jgi:hypothetical protein